VSGVKFPALWEGMEGKGKQPVPLPHVRAQYWDTWREWEAVDGSFYFIRIGMEMMVSVCGYMGRREGG